MIFSQEHFFSRLADFQENDLFPTALQRRKVCPVYDPMLLMPDQELLTLYC